MTRKKTTTKTRTAKKSVRNKVAGTTRKTKKKSLDKTNGAALGFETTLWAAADKLRGHMDAAVYKHVVLGLMFLKYISDAFQETHDRLAATAKTDFTNPEDRDEYTAANIFWVPKKARSDDD